MRRVCALCTETYIHKAQHLWCQPYAYVLPCFKAEVQTAVMQRGDVLPPLAGIPIAVKDLEVLYTVHCPGNWVSYT